MKTKEGGGTSWGNVADWYDEYLEGKSDTYQEQVVSPNLIRLLDIKKGETVLDLACGQGYFSRKYHAAGARVIGADISKELIDYARKHSPAEISYYVSPADNLPFLDDGSVNALSIVLAIQNIENIDETFKECSRVLDARGRIIVVMNHPAFRVPKASDWGYDDAARIEYRKVSRYLSEKRVDIDMHPGQREKRYTASFHRPLQLYFKVLHKHGLCVTRLEEWISHRQSVSGPRAEAENKARKEFPLFLALEIKKHV
jgi:ubiquinone/menaquinone biosynthesis C-methylase UbiE